MTQDRMQERYGPGKWVPVNGNEIAMVGIQREERAITVISPTFEAPADVELLCAIAEDITGIKPEHGHARGATSVKIYVPLGKKTDETLKLLINRWLDAKLLTAPEARELGNGFGFRTEPLSSSHNGRG